MMRTFSYSAKRLIRVIHDLSHSLHSYVAYVTSKSAILPICRTLSFVYPMNIPILKRPLQGHFNIGAPGGSTKYGLQQLLLRCPTSCIHAVVYFALRAIAYGDVQNRSQRFCRTLFFMSGARD
jgi:hypothetical protein